MKDGRNIFIDIDSHMNIVHLEMLSKYIEGGIRISVQFIMFLGSSKTCS